MSVKLIPLSHCVLEQRVLEGKAKQTIAVHKGKFIEHRQFKSDVIACYQTFLKLNATDFALYYEDSYPFCVSLFALLHAQKKVWITANNKSLTAEQISEQGCVLLGDWQGKELQPDIEQNKEIVLEPLDLTNSQVCIFTSGSSGKAKAINKSLQQFQNEIEVLEQCWGDKISAAQVLATVSHQHIYGLLFRVLWPLAAGRCFYSEMFLSPEPLLKASLSASSYWVASPAQLKRLDELTPWQDMTNLLAIFSSGGALDLDYAKQIQQNCQHKVIEVYGSSETGGIAWRQSVDNESWTVFKGIELSLDQQGNGRLNSPFLMNNKPYSLDDRIEFNVNGQFKLLGRRDRIVKIEEKRLSLDELERNLNRSEWVKQSTSLLITGKRDKVATVIILTDKGNDLLQQQGRAQLIKQLRSSLMESLETVVLPKKWLFMSSFPLTTQGKLDRDLISQLLNLNTTRFPQVLFCDLQTNSINLQLRVPLELDYFAGHFPEQPILPGVTQLAWVEHLGKIFFSIVNPFLRMEVIKFKKIIRPGDIIQLKLSWNAGNEKLYFEMDSVNNSHSSGRIVYGYE